MDERFYNFGIKSEISSRRELWDYLLNKKKRNLQDGAEAIRDVREEENKRILSILKNP